MCISSQHVHVWACVGAPPHRATASAHEGVQWYAPFTVGPPHGRHQLLRTLQNRRVLRCCASTPHAGLQQAQAWQLPQFVAVTPMCGSYHNVWLGHVRHRRTAHMHKKHTRAQQTHTHTSCARAHTNEVNVQAGGPSGRPAGCTPCQPRVPWRRNSESSGGTGGRMQRP